MGTCARTLAAALTGLATCGLIGAPEARADGTHGARWLVDVTGQACEKHRAVFEREVALACEAMSTCRVVSPREAELRATLSCLAEESSWWLQTQTIEGAVLSSVELSGATAEDRMREAAVEIARDAAPERTLATESLRNTLSDSDRGKLPRSVPSRLSMMIGGFGSWGAGEASGGGGRLGAGYRLGDVAHLTFGMAGSAGGAGGSLDEFRRLRSGAGIAWGAPFALSPVPFGFALEAGLDGTQRYHFANGDTLAARTHLSGYAQWTIYVHAPFKTVRPYAGAALAFLSDNLRAVGTLDLGVAFPLF